MNYSKKKILLLISLFISAICFGKEVKNKAVIPGDTVLIPWTPMEVRTEGAKLFIECWGRKYIFDQNILPSQIISQGKDILSGPMQIEIESHTSKIEWEPARINIVSKSESKVKLQGFTKGLGADSGIYLQSKIEIEYDGLMTIALSIQYRGITKPDSFAILIPYRNSVSQYYVKWVKNIYNKYSGGISKAEGVVLKTQFTPYFWIGDNYKGLFWFCQSSANWPLAKDKNAIEIVRKDGGVVQKFNIGFTKRFNFGLQATPVKPFPKNWRKYRLMPYTSGRRLLDKANKNYFKLDGGDNYVIHFPNPGYPSSVKFYGYPLASNKKIYLKMISGLHKQGYKFLPYASITRIDNSIPNHYFDAKNIIKSKRKMNLKNDTLVFIDPRSQGYADYIAKSFAGYLKEYHLNGYYLDGGKLLPFWRDSSGRPFYPILAYRKLQRKLYAAIKKADPKAIIIVHMSANMDIPVLAYSDAYLDGEQFRYRQHGKLAYRVKKSYLKVLSLSQFRAEFMGTQWGIIPFFLPEIAPNQKNNLQPTLGLATLLLLHGVLPYPASGNLKVWNKMYEQLDSFDSVNSHFIPYFDSIPPALSQNSNIYVSAYKKDNGQAIIIIGNVSDVPQQSNITLNLGRLGIKAIENVFDMTENDSFSFVDNELEVHLAPLSYKILWIK